mgnify:CR=1 FL=1
MSDQLIIKAIEVALAACGYVEDTYRVVPRKVTRLLQEALDEMKNSATRRAKKYQADLAEIENPADLTADFIGDEIHPSEMNTK